MTAEQKAAHNARSRAWEKRNRVAENAKSAARLKRYRQREPLRYLVLAAKSRSKKEGLPFDLDYKKLSVPTHCPVLGIPMVYAEGSRADGSPSLDRRRPELGYVQGNVVVISWRANHLKLDCTCGDELRRVADYIDGV